MTFSTFSPLTTERLLVPRWRSLAATLKSRELAHPPKAGGAASTGYSPEMVRRLERWRLSPGLVTAAELVEAALVDGRETEAVPAARRLVSEDLAAAPLIRAQAAALLVRAGLGSEVPTELGPAPASTGGYWRGLTRLNPHDPIAWVELALHQTVAGHPEAAGLSMRVARQLAPDNRHILRSAARLYLHVGRPEKAHDLLLRSPATRLDPWLIAAEIALSRLADRDPRFMKLGAQEVEGGGHVPGQITELAGAIGTVHLLDGNRKRSRRMFDTSMRDPTGNALAQGEWATPRIGAEIVPNDRLATMDEHFEATAFHLHRLHRFGEVPDVCAKWAEADPFSLRPYEFGSTAAAYADDFQTAERFAEQGLKRRPTAPYLLNHRAFALASMGRVAEAQACLRKLRLPAEEDRLSYLTAANKGLCAFRDGRTDDGLALYRQAIEGFRRIGQPSASAHARVFLAKEAMLANLPDAPKLLAAAEHAMAPFKKQEGMVVLRRLKGEDPAGTAMADHAAAEEQRRLNKLRSVTFTTPGLPHAPRKLVL